MAPKSATAAAGAAKTKKASTPAAHGSYKDMIKAAIISLKERSGSSRQAIKKYVQANNPLGTTTDAALSKYISQALSSGEKSGEFIRPKGPSGPVKLGKAAPAKTVKAAAKPKAASTTAKKAAPKKTATATKKAAAPKAKANSAKPRNKKAVVAPAVEEKKAVEIAKTKSGRVQKSKAPGAETKKAAMKKAAAAPKKAAPKKSATPKKAA